MVHNVGSVDRIVRIVVAAAAIGIAAAVGFGSIGGVVLLVVAAIMAVTAAVGSCPLYRLVGVNTCPVDQR
ncbi:MAG TPA: DUF2892 domain-containing protein [Microthrixaceae bacterium]|jgi:hypothetical protein|nr:DUF2892 domain-containing protein [Microthrixaceae bacterium]